MTKARLRERLLLLCRLRKGVCVEGRSMLPALSPGDIALIDLRAYRRYPPKPGDIVLCAHPFKKNLQLLKRVHRIDDGCLELRGDNAEESTDSRQLGAIPITLIKGRVTSRISQ